MKKLLSSKNEREISLNHALDQLKVSLIILIALIMLGLVLVLLSNRSFRQATPLEQAISSARLEDGAETNQDLAYCAAEENLVQIISAEDISVSICLNGEDLVYRGLDRVTGKKITLTATKRGRDLVEAANKETTYQVRENGIVIKTYGEETHQYHSDDSYFRNNKELRAPGDLGLEERISYPTCSGEILHVVQRVVGDSEARSKLPTALTGDPKLRYLRTDLSCDNFLTPSQETSGKENIYYVFFTEEYSEKALDSACVTAAESPSDDYAVEILQDYVDPMPSYCSGE